MLSLILVLFSRDLSSVNRIASVCVLYRQNRIKNHCLGVGLDNKCNFVWMTLKKENFFLLYRLIEQRVVQIVQRRTSVIEWDLIFQRHVLQGTTVLQTASSQLLVHL